MWPVYRNATPVSFLFATADLTEQTHKEDTCEIYSEFLPICTVAVEEMCTYCRFRKKGSIVSYVTQCSTLKVD
jgi:hypothetical protein